MQNPLGKRVKFPLPTSMLFGFFLSGHGRLLAAVMESLCQPFIKLTAIMPIHIKTDNGMEILTLNQQHQVRRPMA